MKTISIGLWPAVAVLLAAGTAWAQAAHPVKITNTGKLPVIALSTSAPGKNDWGADMLGARTIGPGKTITIEVKGDCQVDFQAVLDDGKVVEKGGVDVCAPGAEVSL